VGRKDLDGLFGILHLPEAGSNKKKVKAALLKLKEINYLFQKHMAFVETMPSHFPATTSSFGLDPLPTTERGTSVPEPNPSASSSSSCLPSASFLIGDFRKLVFPKYYLEEKTSIFPFRTVDSRDGDKLDDLTLGKTDLRPENQQAMISREKEKETSARNREKKLEDADPSLVSYSDPFVEEKCFPALYPKGSGAYDSNHPQRIPAAQYHKVRLLSVHPAFRQNPSYIFFLEDRLTKKLLFSFSNSVRLSQADREKIVTRADLLGPDGEKFGSVMPASIHGTDAYFAQKFLELCTIIEKLGKPDLFFTMSANDFDEDLIRFLDGKNPRDSPVECGMFVCERVSEILTLLKNSLGVQDYWYRLEYQNRGSPHIHLLAWTKVPLEFNEVDKFIFATVPSQNDPLSKKIAELVRKYQIHRCTSKCRSKNPFQCAYGFPFELTEKSQLSPDGKFVRYKRLREEDRWVVPYHPVLLIAANSNINIQFPTSSNTSIYVAKYAAKAEPTQELTFQNDVERHFRTRKMSVNEACLNLLGKHATQSTCEVIYLNTDPREKMRRRLKSRARLANEEHAGMPEEEIFEDCFRDKYMDRPKELEDVLIVPYLEQYEIFSPHVNLPKKR